MLLYFKRGGPSDKGHNVCDHAGLHANKNKPVSFSKGNDGSSLSTQYCAKYFILYVVQFSNELLLLSRSTNGVTEARQQQDCD